MKVWRGSKAKRGKSWKHIIANGFVCIQKLFIKWTSLLSNYACTYEAEL